MPRKSTMTHTPDVCPVCGEDVPPRALACPECGADDRSGWRSAAGNGLDLPDDEFDYDAFIEEEFGSPVRPRHIHPAWWITAIVLLLALLLYFIT